MASKNESRNPQYDDALIKTVSFSDAVGAMDFTEAEIAISMDGKGVWRDNVFVERLWRSIKYEEVYHHVYKTVSEAPSALVDI